MTQQAGAHPEIGLLVDIAVNLVSALIGFVGGWTLQWIRSHLRLRKARRFWKDFATGNAKVIIGRFHNFDSFEPSGLIGVGDAAALGELERFFDWLRLPRVSIGYSDRVSGSDLKQNLVLLGGPDANAVSNEVVKKHAQLSSSEIQAQTRFRSPTLVQGESSLLACLKTMVESPSTMA